MMKPLIGIALGLLIGVGCRYFQIPLPGPPAILGALLAVAMATGYTLTDRALAGRAGAAAATGPAATGSAAGGGPLDPAAAPREVARGAAATAAPPEPR
jgi:XapX domain-containing protein